MNLPQLQQEVGKLDLRMTRQVGEIFTQIKDLNSRLNDIVLQVRHNEERRNKEVFFIRDDLNELIKSLEPLQPQDAGKRTLWSFLKIK